MIANHYDKTARIDRLELIEGTNKQEFAEHLESVPCHIQPITDEISQDIQGGFGKDFLMLSANVDIAEGDRAIIDEEEYRVMATKALEFGNNAHRETRIRIFKS